MRIFMAITFFESLVLFNQFYAMNICAFRFHEIFAMTIFYSHEYKKLYWSLWILQKCAYAILYFGFDMTVILNTFLCLDLILTIKRPFVRKDSRVNMYFIVAFVVTMSLVTCHALFRFASAAGLVSSVLFFLMCGCFVFLFPFSTIYACIKLN